MRTTEQKLVDICFECVLTVLDHEHVALFTKMSIAERAEWVARQLRASGFDTEPVGASWGVLITNGAAKKISMLDERRLRDADAALTLPEPTTKQELIEQLDAIHSAITALQSLDDLGTIEANTLATSKNFVLQDKYNRLKALLGKEK